MSSHLLPGNPNLKALYTIEIEPEMLRASRAFYPANRRDFDDPRSHYVVDDAKSYFAAAGRKYDFIFSEPSHPWVSGVAGLFTAEFYDRRDCSGNQRRICGAGAVRNRRSLAARRIFLFCG